VVDTFRTPKNLAIAWRWMLKTQSTGLLSAAMASPLLVKSPLWGAPTGADLQTEIKRLKLGHTWTTTMSSSEYRDTLHVRYTNQGMSGVGDGAPIVRYHEDAEGARETVEAAREFQSAADPWQFQKLMQDVFRKIDGQYGGQGFHRHRHCFAGLDWQEAQCAALPLSDWIQQQPPLIRFASASTRLKLLGRKCEKQNNFRFLKSKLASRLTSRPSRLCGALSTSHCGWTPTRAGPIREAVPQDQLARVGRA
jgi:hypothetical protein